MEGMRASLGGGKLVPTLWKIIATTACCCCCCCWRRPSLNIRGGRRTIRERTACGQSPNGIEWHRHSSLGAIQAGVTGRTRSRADGVNAFIVAVVVAVLRACVLGGSSATSNRRFFVPTLLKGNPYRFWPRGRRHLTKFLPLRQPSNTFFFHHTCCTKPS